MLAFVGAGATRIEESRADARAAPRDARQLEVALDGASPSRTGTWRR